LVAVAAARWPSSATPQSPQKRSPGSLAAPQTLHSAASACPHWLQKRLPARFSVPHPEQTTRSHYL
jgi:hypothetical protein